MAPTSAPSLRALALVCSLKKSPAPSSSDLLADQLLDQLRGAGVQGENVRILDQAQHPGVDAHKGPGHEWPAVLNKIKAAHKLND
jgi:hypothetical protein